MKKNILLLAIATLSIVLIAATPKKVQVIETTNLAKDVYGFNGITPVRITVTDGKISEIVPMENKETPEYFNLVKESGIFEKLVGKTPQEALKVKLDAVSGATFSSKAIISNIEAGLKSAAAATADKITVRTDDAPAAPPKR